jgi:SDR family mycofactocin-dependent oxidoreductase
MTGRVAGKVALVTGAARGQGRAHALRLAQEGADIIALDLCKAVRNVSYEPATEEDLARTVKLVEDLDRRVVSRVVDTRDLDALRAAVADGVAALGRLDIVVANAGICIIRPWREVTPEIFRDTVDINLIGTWNTAVASAPHLIASGGGSMILVSSSAGLKGTPFMAPYVASKHGVTGLARALAAEFAKDKVRVNSLHPGGVNTHMGRLGDSGNAIGAALQENPQLSGMFANMLQVEVTEPEDQANAVLFLASEESRFVTAAALPVDNGNVQY